MVQVYRYQMLQAVSAELDAQLRVLARSFLFGAEPDSVRTTLDAVTSLVAGVRSGIMAYFNVFPSASPDANVWPTGEFRILLENDGSFTIYDRIVEEEVRGHGIGSLLLHATERFVQMATPPQHEPCLRVGIGQYYLMNWFEARGFAPQKPGALEAVRADLVTGALIVGQNGYLYAAGTPEHEQVANVTKKQYRRRVVMTKRLTRDGSST